VVSTAGKTDASLEKNAIGMVHIIITTMNIPCKFETIICPVPNGTKRTTGF